MSVRLHHQSADAIHFDLLWQYVGAYPEREVARCHGLSHWKRVEKYGLRIARYSGADATVVRLFALFHDAARVNNDIDEEHGPRAAELAKELCNILYTLDDSRFDLLYEACKYHADGGLTSDPTIGTCWDADRLDLWRVHVQPDEQIHEYGTRSGIGQTLQKAGVTPHRAIQPTTFF